VIDKIREKCIQSRLAGSRVTCDPAPTDTDIDVLCLIDPAQYDIFVAELFSDGFDLDGSRVSNEKSIAESSGFQSFKKGEVNLIVTGSLEFYRRFDAASSVAKRMNMMEKSDRIALFQAVLYGNPCSMKCDEALPQ